MVDSPPGRQELAAPAPPDLFHRNSGRGALHLAGEGRSPQAHRVRHRARHPTRLPRGSLGVRKSVRKTQAARHSSPSPESGGSHQGLEAAEKLKPCIRASLYSVRKNSGFLSGHRFTACGKTPVSYQGIALAMPERPSKSDAPLGAGPRSPTLSAARRGSPQRFFYRNFILQSGLAHPKNERQECLMNPLASTKCAGRLLMALAAITSILLMAACGSSSSVPAPNSQGFNDGSLTGTYVISISGTDVNSSSVIVPFAIAGTIAANGKGGITGGTVDINDPGNLGMQIGQAVNGSSSGYQVGQDGRGSGTLVVASGATFHFDFVLTSASHGLISRFDSFGTGSGTIDFQTPVTSLTGSYAFSLSGTDSGGNPLGTVGAFTLSSNSITGTEDFNDDLTSGPPGFTGLTLTGQ